MSLYLTDKGIFFSHTLPLLWFNQILEERGYDSDESESDLLAPGRHGEEKGQTE